MKTATNASSAAAHRLPPPITASRPVVLLFSPDREGRGVAVGRTTVGWADCSTAAGVSPTSATAWAVGASTDVRPVGTGVSPSAVGLGGTTCSRPVVSLRSPSVAGVVASPSTVTGAGWVSASTALVGVVAGAVASGLAGVLASTGVSVAAGGLVAATAATRVLVGAGVLVEAGVFDGTGVFVGSGVLVAD